jgi:hypothetical protein
VSSGPDVFGAARRVVAAASEAGVTLRVLGGVAVGLRCASASSPPLARTYRDIDFMGLAAESNRISDVFEKLDYVAERRFNALNGHRRLMFRDDAGERTVDVLLDHFEMCHNLDFRDRLGLEPLTLPAADLLLTKLQVVAAEDKDYVDAAIVLDHDPGSTPGDLDTAHIARLCARDWGLYTTVERSLIELGLRSDILDAPGRARVHDVVAVIRQQLSSEPKSARWRARSRIGTRVKWYTLPEEVA